MGSVGRRFGIALLAFAFACLQRGSGQAKGPKELEIVLAQYDEDIAWSDRYADARTVYCKGSQCASDSIRLPNVGREGHTFLKHIVDRYDSLAGWTVFSQAETPTEGYFGRGHKKRGHMLGGIAFEDYLQPAPATGLKLFVTSQVHAPTMKHSLRSSFQTSEAHKMPMHKKPDVCPQTEVGANDTWQSFQDIPEFRHFLSAKCSVEEAVLGEAVRSFWEQYLDMALPRGEIIQFAQGARFGVSKERILARPRAFYERLLETLSEEVDPCINYIMEWAWYYVFAEIPDTPCDVPPAVLSSAVDFFETRQLQDGGVSGDMAVQITGEIRVVTGEVELDLLQTKAQDALEEELNLDTTSTTVSVEATVLDSGTRRLQEETNVYYLFAYTITMTEAGYDDVQDLLTTLEPGSIDGSTFLAAFGDELSTLLGMTVTAQTMTVPEGVNVPTTTSEQPAMSGSERPTIASLFVVLLLGLATASAASPSPDR